MRRLLRFVIMLAVLCAIGIFLANQPGTARVVWRGTVIESSAAVLFFAALLVGFVFYRVWRFYHFLRHGPKHRKLQRHVKKLQKGHDWLTQGLAAVAGGDAAEAGRMAIAARKHLGTTPATQLLQAQAAQLAGDEANARVIYRELTEDPASAVIGYRGLIMAARRAGNYDEVERLADALRAIHPNTPWLKLVRFEIASQRRDWDKAGEALAAPEMVKLMGADKTARARAAVLIIRSEKEAEAGRRDASLQAAEQAARQAPDWLPAILNVTQRQMEAGHDRAARRNVEKNWPRMPHPQLATLARPANMDAMDFYKRLEKLCRPTEDADVTHYVLGEAALAAELWGEARRHLTTLVTRNAATQSVYRMLAKLERHSAGGEQAASQWLTKATDAPADPVWLCRACGGSHKSWQPVCTHCGGFVTLDWNAPGASRAGNRTPHNTPLLLSDWMD